MNLHFYPYDFDYKRQQDKTIVYLYGRQENGTKVCVLHPHEPFFYAQVHDADKATVEKKLKELVLPASEEPARIIRWEEVEKELLGKKQKFWKIFVNYPKAVPLIAEELQSWGLSCYEKDILFVHRYLRDMGILPATLVEAEGKFADEPSVRIPAFHAEQIKSSSPDLLHRWKILAIDIETYAEKKEIDPYKNPILMIAFSGLDENNAAFQKVITWKQFSHQLPFLEHVKDEAALLHRCREIISSYAPDILTGYFSDGFDLPYLKIRAEKLNVPFALGLDGSSILTAANFRDGESRIKGLLHLDMLKFIKYIFGKNLKTDTYSLDAVASELLGHKKHVVNLDNLANIWNNEPEKLAEFCAYNLHDANLTLQLCQKLLPDMLEFTKLIGLPTNDVIRMRFSRLVENYILKRAIEFNVLAPNKPPRYELEQRMDEHVQGAFVYEPTPGLYENIAVFDFRSLYPSIITAHNIGPEGFRCSCCKNQKETRVPERLEYWFCEKEKKFLPTVLNDIIRRRAEIKKLLKEKKAAGEDAGLLESRSYALKLLANSFYGYLGFFGARWYCKECADATTAYARNYIKSTIGKAQEEGFAIVYGDSLLPDRKIFVKDRNKNIELVSIGEFVEKNFSLPTIPYKTLAFDGEKLVFSQIKRVIRHTYHSSEKGDILHFITTHGTTAVTPQHSVYTQKESKVRLADAATLKEGDFLVSLTGTPVEENYHEGHLFDIASLGLGPTEKELRLYRDNFRFPAKPGRCPYCNKEYSLATHVNLKHGDRKLEKRKGTKKEFRWVGTLSAAGGRIPRYWKLTKELAWTLGFYCAEGSASDISTKTGRKCMISFGSQDAVVITKIKRYFDKLLEEPLRIIIDYDKRIKKHMYYYRVQRIPLVGLFVYGFGCGQKSTGKRVPSFIYSSSENLRRAFMEGYLEGDGNKKKDKRYKTHFIRCDTNSKELACGLQYLFKSIRHGVTYFGKEIKHVGWRYRDDKPLISSLRVQSAKGKDSQMNWTGARIKEIKKEHYQGFVYDLEVEESHNFVDAEGLLLVHNTDSMFMLLGKKGVNDALGFMRKINEKLPGQMELEFEGLYPSGIFVAVKGREKGAKKKYALLSDKGKLKITGFETVRRNWSPIAKEVQEKVLRLVLEKKVDEAVLFVKETVKELKQGKVPLQKVLIRTQISRELSQYSALAPHVAIGWQLRKRGENIGPGTIIEYLIVKGTGLVRDRARIPDDVREGQYDPTYYITHQLIPAVASILAVLGYKEEELFAESSQKGLGSFL